MTLPTEMSSSTRPIPAALTGVVRGLKPGDRIRITQAVRINSRWGWAAAIEGRHPPGDDWRGAQVSG